MFDAVHLQNFYEGFFRRHFHGSASSYRYPARMREMKCALYLHGPPPACNQNFDILY
jgi:hypothetical protein